MSLARIPRVAFVRKTFTAPTASPVAFVSRRYASQDYGSGAGDPKGEKPQEQGVSQATREKEHPGKITLTRLIPTSQGPHQRNHTSILTVPPQAQHHPPPAKATAAAATPRTPANRRRRLRAPQAKVRKVPSQRS